MLPPERPDRIQVTFDDHRLAACPRKGDFRGDGE